MPIYIQIVWHPEYQPIKYHLLPGVNQVYALSRYEILDMTFAHEPDTSRGLVHLYGTMMFAKTLLCFGKFFMEVE